jgi:two-component system, cell cycle response regulator
MAERIRRFVSGTPFAVTESTPLPATVSIGVAVLAGAGRTAAITTELVRAADQALYAAKRAGRDRVVAAGVADGAALHRADVA